MCSIRKHSKEKAKITTVYSYNHILEQAEQRNWKTTIYLAFYVLGSVFIYSILFYHHYNPVGEVVSIHTLQIKKKP